MREATLYLASRFLSVLGLQVLSTAFVLTALSVGADALFLGELGLSATIASLLCTLPLGYLVDRLGRKKALLLSQPLLILFSLALAFIPNTTKPSLLICVALFALFRNFRSIAQFSIFGDVLKKMPNPEKWVNLSTLSWQVAFVLGPLLSGFLVESVHVRGAYLSAVMALVIAFLLQQPLLKLADKAPAIAPTLSGSLGELKQFFSLNKQMTMALLLDFIVVFFAGASAILPYLHGSENIPMEVSILRAALPFGVILGTLWALKKPVSTKPMHNLLMATIGFSVLHLLLAGSHHLLISIILLVGAGFFDGISLSVREVLLQVKSPPHLKGRIYSLNNFLVNASDELSEWESGFAAHYLGARPALAIGALAPIAASLYFMKREKKSPKYLEKNLSPVGNQSF